MTTRHEAVRLSFIDDSTTGVLRAATAYAVLDEAIDSVDGSSLGAAGSTSTLSKETDHLSDSAVRGSSSIDQFSGRLGLLARIGAAVGPAFIPIGAVAIPAVTGLANQLGFAAIAGGTAVIAFQGMGDALKAVNKAALEPSIENLEKAQQALEALSPAGQSLVAQLQNMGPLLKELRDSAQEELFPGLITGLQELERLAPGVEGILRIVARTLGDIAAAGAESLTSSRWADFFQMLSSEARPTLLDMASAIGSVVHGFSELWEAFAPLNRSFGGWLKDAAADFDRWAEGLSQTDGFKEFVDYIHENGPKLADAMGAVARAVIEIVEAAAPLGGPILDAITSIADIFAAIADSPLGTPIMAAVTAMSALSLSSAAATAAIARVEAAMLTLGITSKATGAAMASAMAGGAAGGGAAAAAGSTPMAWPIIAALYGFKQLFNNTSDLIQGDMPLWEFGFRSLVPAANILEDFGVNLGFLGDKSEDVALGATLQAHATAFLTRKVENADQAHRALGRTLFNDQKQMLRNARQAEILGKKIKESNQAIRESASAWGDYSHELELGDTSLQTVMDRMRDLAEASRDQAENIRTAVEHGISGKAIRDLIDKFGQQGAALALEELAHAGKNTRAEFERLFGSMKDGEAAVRQAMRGAEESVTGFRHKARELHQQKIAPRVELEGRLLRNGVTHAEGILNGLDRKRPTPKATLDPGNLFRTSNAASMALVDLGNQHPKPKITVDPGNSMSVIHGVISAMSNVHDKVVHITTVFERKNIELRAFGGLLTGPGGPRDDAIPLMGSNGEYVVQAAAVNKYGVGFFDRANAMQLADGGLVSRDAGLNTTSRSTSGWNREIAGFADSIGFFSGQLHVVAVELGKNAGPLAKLRAELDAINERLKQAQRQLRQLEKARDRQEKAIDKQRDVVADALRAVEETLAKMAAFGEDISNRLTKGIFEGADGGNWFSTVLSNLQDNKMAGAQWTRSLNALQNAGLQGPALEALLQQASGDQLAQFANLSPAQIQQFADLFMASTNATQGAGQLSAQAVFGQELADNRVILANQEAHLANMVDVLHDLNRKIRTVEDYIKHEEKVRDRKQKRLDEVRDNLKAIRERHPQEIGDEVGKAFNGATRGAGRRAMRY